MAVQLRSTVGAAEPAWVRLNRASWDEAVPYHLASEFYDVEGFVAGDERLDPFEIEELGPVEGRTLLHLQCHIGLDTICWARHGAVVTGLDFSAPALAAAREIAARCDVEALFVEGEVYGAVEVLAHQYDVVYTGKGALNWLPDIGSWARVVAALTRRGGTVYLTEFHPFVWVFADESLDVAYDYFHRDEPFLDESPGTYADPAAPLANTATNEWAHPIGDVVSALAGAGFRVDLLHEHAHSRQQRWPFMQQVPHKRFELPAAMPSLPLLYSLKATKRG
jgi:SAM-dependent methyltransferase